MTVWFTADTHFGHAGVIRKNARPFEGIAEMREVLVANRPVRLAEILARIGDAVDE